MAKDESKFWQEVKKFIPDISFTRIENLSSLGTPDVLCQNKNGTFFTLELKVTKTNSVRLSPHQISFHIRHPKNTFILVKLLAPSLSKLSDKNLGGKDSSCVMLYDGKQVLDLASRGLKLPARCKGLASCYDLFQTL
jgi:hypothetical protein